jgi:hypothetical protein
MTIIDPCIIFSLLVWLFFIFVYFFNFFIRNKKFLAVVKNIKFRNKKIIQSFILIKQFKTLIITNVFLVIYILLKHWLRKLVLKAKVCFFYIF